MGGRRKELMRITVQLATLVSTMHLMRIEATKQAIETIERVKQVRSGRLTITIGTGCCESTAPFLYEDFWPGPDQEEVGEVAGVTVYAPEFLRELYPGGESVTLDVVDELVESLSVETEFGCRLALRGPHTDSVGESEICVVPVGAATSVPRRVVGMPPEALRDMRIH